MWKTLTIITIVLAGAAATFRFLNTKDAELESQLLSRSVANKEAMEKHLDDFEAKIGEHEEKGTQTEGEAEAEAQKLATARDERMDKESQKTDIEGQIQDKETKLAELNDQLKDIGNIEDAIAKSDSLQLEMLNVGQEIQSASARFKSLVATRANTEKRIATLRDKEVMQKDGKMAAISARVSQSFGDWGFVVINAGARQGVNSGTKLDVKRGDEVVAQIQVTNLESNVSVCDVVSVTGEGGIAAGDRVVVSDDSKWDPEQAAIAAAPPGGAAPGAPAPADGAGAAPAPAPAPAPAGDDDPFGLDPSPAPAADDDPFGLGTGGDPAPAGDGGGAAADDDPFGLN